MLPEERERLQKELDLKHERSASESGLIHYARLTAVKLNDKERKLAKKAAKKEAMRSMMSLEREKELRKSQEAKIKRFNTEKKGDLKNMDSEDDSLSTSRRIAGNRSMVSKKNRSKGSQ